MNPSITINVRAIDKINVTDKPIIFLVPTGTNGARVTPEIANDNGYARVVVPEIKSQSEKDRLESLIIYQPKLTFTDILGNTLFTEYGNFIPQRIGTIPPEKSNVPFVPGQARVIMAEGSNKVEISVLPGKENEWTKATEYISKRGAGQNRIVAWLDLETFIHRMETEFPEDWEAAGHDPFAAAHVGNNPNNVLKKHTIDASKYMISVAQVKQALTGKSFVIEGSFSYDSAQQLTRKINYGSANYGLNLEYSNYIKSEYGTDAFHKAAIAGLIVFALVAIFLIVNYGLLGALSTISMALYVFLTLSFFTIMRGEYSPESIAALIIGIGMAIDTSIITFERFKNEVYAKTNIKKAYKDANRKSLSTIFDANITTMIVAFVLFFFGTRNIIGLSVTLILSIALTLIVMLGFTRITSYLLIRTNWFENRKAWLGIAPKSDKYIQDTLDKPDYIKSSRWFSIGSGVIMFAAVIVLIVFASIAQSFSGGFNLSQDFSGGTVIDVHGLDAKSISAVNTTLISHGIQANEISDLSTSSEGILKVKTLSTIDAMQLKKDLANQFSGISININTTTNSVAKKLLLDALISVAIAIGAIILYTFIRFKWSYSIAAVIALLHDAIIVISFFVIFRIEISPVFVAGLLSIIGYSINDTIVTFDRVREKMHAHTTVLTKDDIKNNANAAIKETIKRSIYTSLTTIAAVVVLMSFGNATKMSFNLAMLIGLVAGTYSSIFIATYVWTKLEWIRQKSMTARQEKGYWNIQGIEEETVIGINDIRTIKN